MNAPTGPVLIVTTTDDSHADIMVEEFLRREVPVVRFHPEDFPVRSSITLFATDDGQDWDGVIATQGREVRLSEIRAAWYRRPNDPVVEDAIPIGLNDFALRNARDMLNACYEIIADRWLASPHNLRRAELKTAQLQAAARAGLVSPATIFSNDPSRATRFRKTLAGRGDQCAVKAMRAARVVTHDSKIWLPYTSLWPDELLPDAIDNIALAPSIYQRYQPRKLEIRAVVVGDRTFAACVDPAADPDSAVDVRRGDLTKTWIPYYLPEATAAALVSVTRALGVHCCSADFLLTPDDELVFIELNPNGQWLWLDLYAGLPLVRVFADYLSAGIGSS